MTALAEQMAQKYPQVFALPRDQRIALAHQLWDSVQADLEADAISPEFVIELERRIAELRADPSIGVPWEVVQAAAAQRRLAKRPE